MNKIEAEEKLRSSLKRRIDRDSFSTSSLFSYLKANTRTELFEILLKIFHSPHIHIQAYLLLFVLVTSALASFTVVQSCVSYFSYQVTTNARTIYETPTLFPKITICNLNMFTTQYALDFLTGIDGSILNLDTIPSNLTNAESNELVNYIFYQALNIAVTKNFTEQERQMFSHSFDDILLTCYFNGQLCTANDFIAVFDSAYGNCLVFNSDNKIKTSSVAGSLYGLQLQIYTGFNENLTKFNSYVGGRGLLVRIDNSSYLTDHNVDGVKISAGFHHNIAVERSFKFMLPIPYSNCEVDRHSSKTSGSDLYRLITDTEYEYTQQLCFLQCYQKMVVLECNCTDSLLSLYNVSRCLTPEQGICLDRVFFKKYMLNNYIESNCLPLCPLECNKTEYKTALTSYKLIGDKYLKNIQHNENLRADFVTRPLDIIMAGESVTSLNIYYDSLSYLLSTESPQLDIIGLLASIGGNLGLFLGVSVLSVCELFELLIEISFNKK